MKSPVNTGSYEQDKVPVDGLEKGQLIWAVIALSLGVGMSALDTAIANTALPAMAQQLHATPADSVWIVNAYQLAMVATLLPIAALGETIGYKRIYIAGMALFTAASLGCALAWSLPVLIVARLLYASRGTLALAAAALFALYLALPALALPLAWPDPAWLGSHVEQANQVVRNGSWWQVTRFSWDELPFLLPLHVHIFPRTLGLFVLGMLAWRCGIFSRAAGHRLAIVRLGCLLGTVGIALALADTHGLSNLAPVCLALAFAAAILYAVECTSARALLRPFSAIGRMAFTNYIGQSLVFGWLFFGYGLGWFGLLRPAPVLALGIAVYVVQVQLSRLWLRHYRFGPIEWLWRTLMYGARQAMRR
jgi:MFS family permease